MTKILTDAELAEIRAELARRESEIYGLGHAWYTIKQLLDTVDELTKQLAESRDLARRQRRIEC